MSGYSSWSYSEVTDVVSPKEFPEVDDVPSEVRVMPDGSEAVVIGDIPRWNDVGHPQGQNSLGYEGTCGLVSVEEIACMSGTNVNEDVVVRYAAERGLCAITDNPTLSGGTTPQARVEILHEMGVPAHIETHTTTEDIAGFVEDGRGVMVRVNAGVLWDDPTSYDGGQPNHAVVITGVARNPSTDEVTGVFLNDSGNGHVGQYVDRELFEAACSGYQTIVTDVACV